MDHGKKCQSNLLARCWSWIKTTLKIGGASSSQKSCDTSSAANRGKWPSEQHDKVEHLQQ